MTLNFSYILYRYNLNWKPYYAFIALFLLVWKSIDICVHNDVEIGKTLRDVNKLIASWIEPVDNIEFQVNGNINIVSY